MRCKEANLGIVENVIKGSANKETGSGEIFIRTPAGCPRGTASGERDFQLAGNWPEFRSVANMLDIFIFVLTPSQSQPANLVARQSAKETADDNK